MSRAKDSLCFVVEDVMYLSYDIIEVAWCCNDQVGGVGVGIKRRGKE